MNCRENVHQDDSSHAVQNLKRKKKSEVTHFTQNVKLMFYISRTFLNSPWPNSHDCTDLNQCGVRRDAELCRLCYK